MSTIKVINAIHPSGSTNNIVLDNAGNASIGAALTAATTVSDGKGEVRSIPINSQTTAYTVVSGDAGKFISITTGGVTVATTTAFTTGQSVSVYNNSGSSQTITQGASVTMYFAGSGATGNRTLGLRGLCTIFCVGTDTYVITGGGLT